MPREPGKLPPRGGPPPKQSGGFDGSASQMWYEMGTNPMFTRTIQRGPLPARTNASTATRIGSGRAAHAADTSANPASVGTGSASARTPSPAADCGPTCGGSLLSPVFPA